jgi:hypothetical protein
LHIADKVRVNSLLQYEFTGVAYSPLTLRADVDVKAQDEYNLFHYESYSTHLCIEPRRQQIGTSRGETDKNQLDLTAESNLRDFARSLTSSCSLMAGINYISVVAHYRSQPKDTMQLLSSLP